MRRILILFISLMLCLSIVSAVPVTDPVGGITNSQVTFHATVGAGTIGWFEWGKFSGGPYYWSTPNQSTPGATFEDFQFGPPMLTGYTYYVRACDETGCDATDVAFVVPAATPLNQTHFGADTISLMRRGFNLTLTSQALVHPFTATTGTSITFGLMVFFIFAGIWIRQKDLFLPAILGIIAGGFIWGTGAALGVPPEFVDMGQMLLYISIAGIVYSWFSR